MEQDKDNNKINEEKDIESLEVNKKIQIFLEEDNSNQDNSTQDNSNQDKSTQDNSNQDKLTQDKSTQMAIDKSTQMNIDKSTQMAIYSYNDIDEMFEIYENQNSNNSSIIDIIGVYVKGQKILYTEAKTVCEKRLTCLMLPSILLTVVCSIGNLVLKDYVYGNVVTSILNGTIAFILALINYLKLDAMAEAHRSSAYKYDKLLSYVHFQSGKQLFLKDEAHKMSDIISKIEKDVTEIKETNQFVLPEKIRYNFPYLSGVNIFTVAKNISNKEIKLKNNLANVMNKIAELQLTNKSTCENELKNKLQEKDILFSQILEIQTEYVTIDNHFESEMKKYRERSKYKCKWLKCFTKNKNENNTNTNINK